MGCWSGWDMCVTLADISAVTVAAFSCFPANHPNPSGIFISCVVILRFLLDVFVYVFIVMFSETANFGTATDGFI